MLPNKAVAELPAIRNSRIPQLGRNAPIPEDYFVDSFASSENESATARTNNLPTSFVSPESHEPAVIFPPAYPLLPVRYGLYETNSNPKYRLVFTPKPNLCKVLKRGFAKTPLKKECNAGNYQEYKRDASLRRIEPRLGMFTNEIIVSYSKENIGGINDTESVESSDFESDHYETHRDESEAGPKLVFSRGGRRYGIHLNGTKLDIADLISSKSTILYSCEYLIKAPYKAKRHTNLPIGELTFDSRFESGNLQYAIKVKENVYQLIVQNDTNSTSRFYFKVLNMAKGQEVEFTILNISKDVWLYNKGMKIAVLSKQAKRRGIGWFRGGENIEFSQNEYMNTAKEGEHYYSLSFTYKFEYDGDEVYFAYSLPYTYTQLTDYLKQLTANYKTAMYMEKHILCKTVGGIKCEYLIISNKQSAGETGATVGTPMGANKKLAILTARVHPGEAVSSWMMKGIIDFLVSDNPLANTLREHFIFLVIPMLNPDGVVYGNYRCCATGSDLNRKYLSPSKIFHPTIYYTKKLLRRLSKVHPVALYLDFHGHSGAQDIFAYGNTDADKPEVYRVFPYILSQLSGTFSFGASRFGVQSSKLSTARICMWKELAVPFVYTIEASFFGPKNSKEHFTIAQLEEIGKKSCEALLVLYKFGGNKEARILGVNYEEILQELAKNRLLIKNECPEDDSENEDDKLGTPLVLPIVGQGGININPSTQHHRTKSSINNRPVISLLEYSPNKTPSNEDSLVAKNRKASVCKKKCGIIRNYIRLVDAAIQTEDSQCNDKGIPKMAKNNMFLPYFMVTPNNMPPSVKESNYSKITGISPPKIREHTRPIRGKHNMLKIIGTKPVPPSQHSTTSLFAYFYIDLQSKYYIYNEKELVRPILPKEDKAINTSPIFAQKEPFCLAAMSSKPRRKSRIIIKGSKEKLNLSMVKNLSKGDLEALLHKKPDKVLKRLHHLDVRQGKSHANYNSSKTREAHSNYNIKNDTKSFLDYGNYYQLLDKSSAACNESLV